MKQPTLLCFCSEPEVEKKARLCAMQNRVFFKKADETLQGRTLGAIFGIAADDAPVAEEKVPDMMLIMAFFTPPLMDRLLLSLKKNGIGNRLIKAVLTPSNAEWTPGRLFEELTKERDAIAAGSKARHE